jgi:hypothetical protein
MKRYNNGADFSQSAREHGARVCDFGATHAMATDKKGRSVIYPKGYMRPSAAGVVIKIFKLLALLALAAGAYGFAIRM